MSNIKGKVNTALGTFWNSKGNDLTFQEALDEAAKCCPGVSCCQNALYLNDTETGERVKIQVTNGALTINGPPIIVEGGEED